MGLVEKIKGLCINADTTIGALEKELGFGKGTMYRWNDMIPSADKVQRVADYFDTSVDYLLGRTDEESPIHSDDVDEYREMLHKDKRYGVLLSASKKLTAQDLDALIHIVNGMGGDND